MFSCSKPFHFILKWMYLKKVLPSLYFYLKKKLKMQAAFCHLNLIFRKDNFCTVCHGRPTAGKIFKIETTQKHSMQFLYFLPCMFSRNGQYIYILHNSYLQWTTLRILRMTQVFKQEDIYNFPGPTTNKCMYSHTWNTTQGHTPKIVYF